MSASRPVTIESLVMFIKAHDLPMTAVVRVHLNPDEGDPSEHWLEVEGLADDLDLNVEGGDVVNLRVRVEGF